jgi:hypothetical protein
LKTFKKTSIFYFLFLTSVFDENEPVKRRGADTMVKAPIGFGLLLNIINITSLD